jgi:hypothetical protein
MAWAHIQGNTGFTSAGTSFTITMGSNVQAGHMVLVAAVGNVPITSVTDTAGNTYTQLYTESVNGTSVNGYVFQSIISTGGFTVITVNLSGAGVAAGGADEFSFTPGEISVSGNSVNNNTSGSTTPSSGAVSWSGNALLYNAVVNALATATFTQPSGFTLWQNLPLSAGVNQGVFTCGILNDTSSPNSCTGSFNNSATWADFGIAFESSGDNSPPSTGGSAIYLGRLQRRMISHY